ncbi:MAG: co-chaperone GroES [Bacteroidales bacterium]|nr:co-chaperone GroES [Bacteroidales bacterium]
MSELKIRPIAGTDNRVLVEPNKVEEKTASGIIIPDSAKEKPQQGKVVAVSDDLKDVQPTVKIGDIVMYGKYGGTELTFEGVDYLMMKESDIYAVIKL